MIITSIKPFEKGKNRVAVYLNDEFAFVLYKGELSKYKLVENMDFSDELYQRILNETLYKRARLRGMNLLQKMDRTEYDLRKKLREGGYPQCVIDDAINYLKSFHYVDDARYAADYIRFKINSCSQRVIAQKLKEKGIPDSIIEEQLSEYINSNDDAGDKEIELVKKLIVKKCHGIIDISSIEYEEKMKIVAFLYRKGFGTDTIEKAFRDLT